MADTHSNPTIVRGIDYRAAFPFVHLFKAFRLAIDPSKLLLALALLLLVYAGGRTLDAVWPERHRAVSGEIEAYTARPVDFGKYREQLVLNREAAIAARLGALGHGDLKPDYEHLVDALRIKRDDSLKLVNEQYEGRANKNDPDDARIRDERVQAVHATYAADTRAAKPLASEGLFIHFLQFEIHAIDVVVMSAVNLNLNGVVSGLSDFFLTAPAWAFRFHPFYFCLFFAWFLILWSIFGGALARIASVQVARDEKISMRAALRFSTGKVLSFVFAPLIPIIIIAVLGVVLAVASILISVPGISGIWSIVIGLVFGLALLAGLVMMLTAVGLIGGGHLMFPTIASEGSDSFDAVSRSFSYLYARPWQLGFYALISIVYGAITYLVVRLALFILLLLVHGSVNLFQWGRAADGTPVFEAMWPRPTNFMTLSYDVHYASLGPVQSVGASLIAFWVYLAISMLGAYVISLYFSSSTLVYFLLRRDVDATELDEVYLEPNDEDLTDAAAATIEPTVATPMTNAVADEPAGQPIDLPVPPKDEPTA